MQRGPARAASICFDRNRQQAGGELVIARRHRDRELAVRAGVHLRRPAGAGPAAPLRPLVGRGRAGPARPAGRGDRRRAGGRCLPRPPPRPGRRAHHSRPRSGTGERARGPQGCSQPSVPNSPAAMSSTLSLMAISYTNRAVLRALPVRLEPHHRSAGLGRARPGSGRGSAGLGRAAAARAGRGPVRGPLSRSYPADRGNDWDHASAGPTACVSLPDERLASRFPDQRLASRAGSRAHAACPGHSAPTRRTFYSRRGHKKD